MARTRIGSHSNSRRAQMRAPFAALLACVAIVSVGADGVTRVPANTWIVDGGITGAVADGNTVILAGGFSHIGLRTGMFTILDPQTGAPFPGTALIEGGDASPSFMSDLVADGHGGYIFAARFATVNGAPRTGLVRLFSNGALNPPFQPPSTVSGEHVAVLGNRVFTTRRVPPFFQLVALDLDTGQELSWSSPVLVRDVEQLYSAGDAILVESTTELRSVDAVTGQERWTTTASEFAMLGASAFVSRGGSVFRLDLATGATTAFIETQGTCTVVACRVTFLAVSSTTVYMLGSFQTVEGVPRQGGAAVDRVTGAVLPWTPPTYPETHGPMRAWVGPDRIIVSYGRWNTNTTFLLALDPVTGVDSGWRGYLMQSVTLRHHVIVEPTRIVAAGRFIGAGGVERRGLARVTWPLGAPTAWAAELPVTYVDDMALAGSRLYVSRSGFTSSIFQLDANSGELLSSVTGITGSIYSLDAFGDRLYVGGDFQQLQGQARSRLASYDITSELQLTPWAPSADRGVQNVLALPGVVLVSGFYTSINGESRPGVAAVDATTGAVLPWNLQSNGYASSSFDFDADRVWLAGRFGQQAFNSQGLPVAYFPPHVDFNRTVLWPYATVFGDFLYIANETPYAVHRTTGRVSPWRPELGPSTSVRRWFRAGAMGLVAERGEGGFAFYPRVLPPAAPSALAAQVSGTSVTLSWNGPTDASTYVLEAGSGLGRSDLAILDTNSAATTWSGSGPDGVYFVRVRSNGDGGTSAPSNELRIALGSGACSAAPSAPTSFTLSNSGDVVTGQWTAVSAPVSRYVLLVGLRTGATDVQLDVGLSTSINRSAPSGTYFVRVAAENRCGLGAPSSEVVLTIP